MKSGSTAHSSQLLFHSWKGRHEEGRPPSSPHWQGYWLGSRLGHWTPGLKDTGHKNQLYDVKIRKLLQYKGLSQTLRQTFWRGCYATSHLSHHSKTPTGFYMATCKILPAVRHTKNDLLAFFRHRREAHKTIVSFSNFKFFPTLKYILSLSLDLLIIVSSWLWLSQYGNSMLTVNTFQKESSLWT